MRSGTGAEGSVRPAAEYGNPGEARCPAATGCQSLELSDKRPTLLHFRTRGCTVCDLFDMKVAQACQRSAVKLIIIDRYAKLGAPEDRLIYDQPDNILDKGRAINERSAIGVYPSFVLVNSRHQVVLKDVGAKAPPESFSQYLEGKFRLAISQN